MKINLLKHGAENRTKRTYSLPQTVVDELDAIRDETGVMVSRMVQTAINTLIAEYRRDGKFM